jgi:hypothetical protein
VSDGRRPIGTRHRVLGNLLDTIFPGVSCVISRERLEGGPTTLGVDQVALDVGDLRPQRHPVEHEVAQPVHVRDANVDEEVVRTRHVEDLDHLR